MPRVPDGAGVRAGPVPERHRARVCADEGDAVLPAERPPGPGGPLPHRCARGRAGLRLPRQTPHPLLRHVQEGVGCHFLLQCMKVKVKVKSVSRV